MSTGLVLIVALLVLPSAALAQSAAATDRPVAGLATAGIDPQLAEDSVPRIQIWRSGQTTARTPKRVPHNRFSQVALDETDEAVLVRLAFPSAQRGRSVQILTQDGWSLSEGAGEEDAAPLEGVTSLRLRPNGRVSFVLRRAPTTRSGVVKVVVNGVASEMRFVVLSAENQARLRRNAPSVAASLGLEPAQ